MHRRWINWIIIKHTGHRKKCMNTWMSAWWHFIDVRAPYCSVCKIKVTLKNNKTNTSLYSSEQLFGVINLTYMTGAGCHNYFSNYISRFFFFIDKLSWLQSLLIYFFRFLSNALECWILFIVMSIKPINCWIFAKHVGILQQLLVKL